ncbi:MAG: prepilin-type N-terminal cleavage/methylation domain-containing protein [Betaproteobacteria bacterium]|nr:MAG: prepilin-type N-terminal cleavage/methylation domain-containing protein [Betaproteobacteria bacterium]
MAIECAMRPMRCRRRYAAQHGVTLIELIIVIAITAVIAGGVAVFISRPFESYVDSARRAELTDIADTALRRMTRDLRTALPNSIRIACVPSCGPLTSTYYLEYLQTSGGGRYRADVDSSGAGNILDFTFADTSFDVVGPMPTFSGGEWIVIYNLASSGTIANAYDGSSTTNRGAYASNAGNTITLSPGKQFPYPSPGKRFSVVQYAVTYACNPTTGELRRYWNYGIAAAQATPPVTANNALLANNVSATNGCSFTYAQNDSRTGVVGLAVRIERSGETVQLFQQAHVNNVP